MGQWRAHRGGAGLERDEEEGWAFFLSLNRHWLTSSVCRVSCPILAIFWKGENLYEVLLGESEDVRSGERLLDRRLLLFSYTL